MNRILACFLFAICVTNAQTTYKVVSYFTTSSCTTNTMTGIIVAQIACTVGNVPCSGGIIQTCTTTPPNYIAGGINYAYYGTTACAGQSPNYGSFIPNTCMYYGSGGLKAVCASGSIQVSSYTDATCATSTGFIVTVSNGCNTQGTGSTYSSCGGGGGGSSCFHKDTIITYNNSGLLEYFTLADVRNGKNSHCVVPHIVKTSGLNIITTSESPQKHTIQTLRLTPEHLVYTARGLMRADQLILNDVVYRDFNEQLSEKIVTITHDSNEEYFGLNCIESDVLANGYKTSTFGVTHNIPAFWMKYGSYMLGIHRASYIGDRFAAFLHYCNIF